MTEGKKNLIPQLFHIQKGNRIYRDPIVKSRQQYTVIEWGGMGSNSKSMESLITKKKKKRKKGKQSVGKSSISWKARDKLGAGICMESVVLL